MARGLMIGEGVKIRAIKLAKKTDTCPQCGALSKRHSFGHRWLRDVGIACPVILEVTHGKYFCETCQRHFAQRIDLAPKGSNFTNRVHRLARDLIQQGLTYEATSKTLRDKYRVYVPASTIHEWVVTGV